jgi:hypothetical protein
VTKYKIKDMHFTVTDHGDKSKLVMTNEKMKYRGSKWVMKSTGSIKEAQADLISDYTTHCIAKIPNHGLKGIKC